MSDRSWSFHGSEDGREEEENYDLLDSREHRTEASGRRDAGKARRLKYGDPDESDRVKKLWSNFREAVDEIQIEYRLDDRILGLSGSSREKGLAMVDDSKLSELEAKWSNLERMKTDYSLTRLGLIQQQGTFVLEALERSKYFDPSSDEEVDKEGRLKEQEDQAMIHASFASRSTSKPCKHITLDHNKHLERLWDNYKLAAVEISSKHPCGENLTGLSDAVMRRGIGILECSVARELEAKWGQLQIMKVKFMLKRLEVIQEQGKTVLEALN